MILTLNSNSSCEACVLALPVLANYFCAQPLLLKTFFFFSKEMLEKPSFQPFTVYLACFWESTTIGLSVLFQWHLSPLCHLSLGNGMTTVHPSHRGSEQPRVVMTPGLSSPVPVQGVWLWGERLCKPLAIISFAGHLLLSGIYLWDCRCRVIEADLSVAVKLHRYILNLLNKMPTDTALGATYSRHLKPAISLSHGGRDIS